MSTAQDVYTGVWINYSKGVVLGATITLSSRYANILTAFLAAFVKFVGSQMWSILSFAIHQWRSSLADKDGLYHQRQVLFRNTNSPLSAAWIFTKQWWAWKRVMDGTFLRSFGWIIFATSYALLFAVCSVLVGEVSGAESTLRLLKPSSCGFLVQDSVGIPAQTSHNFLSINSSIKAADYVKRCYSSSIPALGCTEFVQRVLNLTTNINATCPFKEGMCVYSDTAAFSLDTGLLDSRDHFGVNSADSDRLGFRKLTTCAPIVLTNYTTHKNSTLAPDYFQMEVWAGQTTANTTFAYETVASNTNQGWDVSTVLSMNQIQSTWIPIPMFNRTDADVSMIFITPNSVYFEARNYDPIFGATRPLFNTTQLDGTIEEFYDSNKFIAAIGCMEQFQVCHPDGTGCTPLDGIYPMLDRAIHNSVPFNPVQLVTAVRFATAASSTLVSNLLDGRGGSVLHVQEMVHGLKQSALPSNQWMLEVLGWSQSSLAAMQQAFADYVAQPADIAGYHVQGWPDKVNQGMCHSQLTRTTNNTTSFSVLGVSIILGVGGLIVLVSLIIEPVVGFVRNKFMKASRYKQLNWILDDKFQIQRMMYEGAGMGGKWRNAKAAVPTTTEPVPFGGWFGVDHEHPSVHQLQRKGNMHEEHSDCEEQHGAV
ncbi:hypothetical protein K461DRAFT_315187 [Myriangium duriaei CBS 260.36]|uniref:Uncharacterized protein n=1 Tax=Myriangium duriaei CBS 260.36 TaxID=1168546 RepID=A0A9P4IYV6_9PEZI|nr:hypothetical protein K461DRAFT_315187 [Myriangium duriaei CBS 260.36]